MKGLKGCQSAVEVAETVWSCLTHGFFLHLQIHGFSSCTSRSSFCTRTCHVLDKSLLEFKRLERIQLATLQILLIKSFKSQRSWPHGRSWLLSEQLGSIKSRALEDLDDQMIGQFLGHIVLVMLIPYWYTFKRCIGESKDQVWSCKDMHLAFQSDGWWQALSQCHSCHGKSCWRPFGRLFKEEDESTTAISSAIDNEFALATSSKVAVFSFAF